MARPKTTPKNEERPFLIHELFFSTTDRVGVILSGNEVFRRVAAFDSLEEMIGKPHNIIRHKDMPRAVFKLLWDYLAANKTICAYVKNQAQDGAFYWVFALVVPIEGGYLSVRFKPSSPIFQIVKGLYIKLREIELETDDKPKLRDAGMQKAGDAMLQALQELGFPDYDTFMRTALATEMGARAKGMAASGYRRPQWESADALGSTLEECRGFEAVLNRMFLQVETFLELIQRLQSKSEFLSKLAGNISLLSLNSLISCQRHGEQGRGVAVVAETLSRISKESISTITGINERINDLVGALRESAYHISAAKLQVEISILFLGELIDSHEVRTQLHHDDLQMLTKSFDRTIQEIGTTLPSLIGPLSSLTGELRDLRGTMRGLSRVHLIGLIEAAHLDGANDFLQLFTEVATELAAAKTELEDFAMEIELLQQGLPGLIGETNSLCSERHSLCVA